jgi:L-ascorbate metabolism protein UlaG (beta-lactamase superfamily)
MGDTDSTPEALQVKCDVCFVPIGGTFTMDYLEASEYINKIKPKKVIPIHYGKIIGDLSLGEKFKEKIDKDIEVDILIGG